MAKKTTQVQKPIKARALAAGEKVGLVCPASRPPSPSVVEKSIRIVEAMGLKAVVGKHVLGTHGYLSGTVDERLEDLMGFWLDDSIAGIFCITGGFGSMHLLPYLDYKYISAHPKIILGCDDNTTLLVALAVATGLVTFIGPNLDQVCSKYSFERFKLTVTRNAVMEPIWVTEVNHEDILPPAPYTPIAGCVEGPLLGGNLTALVSLMGTPYQPCFKDVILFLEDKNERNDILDRWFTTLYVARKLSHARGVVFGQFKDCHPRGAYNMLSLEDLFGDRLRQMAKPSCFGMPFGQDVKSATIAIGIQALFDAKEGRLEFLEPALLHN